MREVVNKNAIVLGKIGSRPPARDESVFAGSDSYKRTPYGSSHVRPHLDAQKPKRLFSPWSSGSKQAKPDSIMRFIPLLVLATCLRSTWGLPQVAGERNGPTEASQSQDPSRSKSKWEISTFDLAAMTAALGAIGYLAYKRYTTVFPTGPGGTMTQADHSRFYRRTPPWERRARQKEIARALVEKDGYWEELAVCVAVSKLTSPHGGVPPRGIVRPIGRYVGDMANSSDQEACYPLKGFNYPIRPHKRHWKPSVCESILARLSNTRDELWSRTSKRRPRFASKS